MSDDFSNLLGAVEDLKQGRMVILVDDTDRENEGDLVVAADKITAEHINFMSQFGRGLICLPMAPDLVERLALPMMVNDNQSPYQTAFTVSIEAKEGVSTGISAHDRAHTIRTAVDPQVSRGDIVSPGHVFPLKAKSQGVLARQGQTEGSVDLMEMAGLTRAAVICEIVAEDGTMARGEVLTQFAKQHHLRKISVEEILHYRWYHEELVSCDAESYLPTEKYGRLLMQSFSGPLGGDPYICITKAPMAESPLVRLHSECLTGDVFGSLKCDCQQQLHKALEQIGAQGGMLIYLPQEGRGIGITNKLKAYALQEKGLDTVEANTHLGLPVDERDYAIAAQILKYHRLQHVRLMTNNPEKITALQRLGLDVERVPLMCSSNKHNADYLSTKQQKLGHMFE